MPKVSVGVMISDPGGRSSRRTATSRAELPEFTITPYSLPSSFAQRLSKVCTCVPTDMPVCITLTTASISFWSIMAPP